MGAVLTRCYPVMPPAPALVRNRKDLFAALFESVKTMPDPAAAVRECMVAYTPPAERLIIRNEADLAALSTNAEALKAAADVTFWAYKDFDSVLASFALDATDPERRVMGIEGVGSGEELQKILASGQAILRIGHLSLLMMEGKVANGEWRWVDEDKCVMYTATNKPALMRPEVRSRLGIELRILRHEKFLEAQEGQPNEQTESMGDLIIFDMDWKDSSKDTGNTKVFCQNPSGFTLNTLDALMPSMDAALGQVLQRELTAATTSS